MLLMWWDTECGCSECPVKKGSKRRPADLERSDPALRAHRALLWASIIVTRSSKRGMHQGQQLCRVDPPLRSSSTATPTRKK